MLPAIMAVVLLAYVHTTARPASLSDVMTGKKVAGFTLDRGIDSVIETGKGVTKAWRGKGLEPFNFETVRIEFEPSKEPGAAVMVLMPLRFDGEYRPAAVYYKASWPSNEGVAAEARRAGITIGAFEGWSSSFGAIHHTDRADILVGLTTDRPGDESATHIGWILRMIPDFRTAEARAECMTRVQTEYVDKQRWAEDDPRLVSERKECSDSLTRLLKYDAGPIETLAEAERYVELANERGARLAMPHPLPYVGGDALREKFNASVAPITASLEAIPESPGLSPLQKMADYLDEKGGPGADLPEAARAAVVKRVRAFHGEVRSQAAAASDASARATLEALAADAEDSAVSVGRDAGLADFLGRASRLLAAARDWASPEVSARMRAWMAMHSVASVAPTQAERNALLAIANAHQPALSTQSVTAAGEAMARGHMATAAAHWLLAQALRPGAVGIPAVEEGSITNWAEEIPDDGSPRWKARKAIAALGLDMVPVFLDEFRLVWDWGWPTKPLLGLSLGVPSDFAAAGATACVIHAGPMQYDGSFTTHAEIIPGTASGQWVTNLVGRQTEQEWREAMEQKEFELRHLYLDPKPVAPVGRPVSGPVHWDEHFYNPYSGESGTATYSRDETHTVYDPQSLRDAARNQYAGNTSAAVVSDELARMRKEGPSKGHTETTWVPDGSKTADVRAEVQDWLGQPTRVLTADCGRKEDTSGFRTIETFDAAARSAEFKKMRTPENDGFMTREQFLDRISSNDRSERSLAGLDLQRAVIVARIAAWRASATGKPEELDAEAAWRTFFFTSGGKPPISIPVILVVRAPSR